MANLNVNIAKKLISYVRHGVDIDDRIKEIYQNSLIFIGDESQIYVPAMNTYVGIGTTAYNQTINRISSIENDISELKDTLATDLVTKIYANYSLDEMLGEGDATPIKADSTQRPYQINDNGKDLWALNNEITLKGVGDYDPSTGFSRTVANPYVLDMPEESGLTTTLVTNSALYRKDGKALASSGITITPHWGEMHDFENEATGQVVSKRVGNYIEIDDKLTWSYMTSAYSYTMNFAKKYTASEIDRLYHNLLGDYQATYLPINFEEVAVDESTFINALSADEYADYVAAHTVIDLDNNGVHTYYVIDNSREHQEGGESYSGIFIGAYLTNSSYTTNENPQEVVRTGDVVYHELTKAELVSLLGPGGSAAGIFTPAADYSIINYTSQQGEYTVLPQFYGLDAQYDSTYNMNIADGINTLKEVAYLLDKLSDGSLGTTTYFTYAQVKETGVLDWNGSIYTYNTGSASYPINWNTNQIDLDNGGEITSWNSPKDTDVVGWYVIQGDQENLGIQIAYSIAGNKMQIDDLHTHAELLEKGETTLRSIQATGSEFAQVDLVGGTYHWTNTDTKQGESDDPNNPYDSTHPNWNINNAGNRKEATSYLVGDVNIKVKLNTASVYATTYTADVTASTGTPINSKFVDEFGVTWFGTYTAADMNSLVAVPAGTPLTSDTTYYVIDEANTSDPDAPVFKRYREGDAGVAAEDYGRLSETDIDNRYQLENVQYYWIPGGEAAKNDGQQNIKYVKMSRAEIGSLGDNDVLQSDFTPALTKSTATFWTYNEATDTYQSRGTWADIQASSQLDGINTFYYISGYDTTQIHAVTGENKVATTEWVGAFVDTKVGEIAADLENTLDEAKEYTDEQIRSLDNNYIFTDFSSYWTYFQDSIASANADTQLSIDGDHAFRYGDLRTPGTNAYNYTYNKFYADYQDTADPTSADFRTTIFPSSYVGENPYRLSYISNSQYTYNVVEEDGIVTAEARELPTDRIKANAQIWGDDANVAAADKHQYSDVTLSHARGVALFDALYSWAAANDDNQIFVELFDASDASTYSFIPLDPTVVGDVVLGTTLALDGNGKNTVGGTDDGLYEFYNGNYVTVSTLTDRRGEGFNAVNYKYTNTADKFWFRLYQKGPVHYELNLQDAVALNTSGQPFSTGGTLDKNNIKIGDYTLTKSGSGASATVNVAGPGITGSTPLLYISTRADASTKYFSVENKHFSYVNNGNGENELSVTAHITRIEDASSSNTGFADAFDVQSYIENYFRWIDISASVSEERVLHSDDYYTTITLSDYNKIVAAAGLGASVSDAVKAELPYYVEYAQDGSVITPTLYTREDITNQNPTPGAKLINYAPVVGNPTVNIFWKDNNAKYEGAETVLADAELAAIGSHVGHITVGGDYLYEQFNSNAATTFTKASNYYVRLEEPKVNPINLTETVFGDVPIAVAG